MGRFTLRDEGRLLPGGHPLESVCKHLNNRSVVHIMKRKRVNAVIDMINNCGAYCHSVSIMHPYCGWYDGEALNCMV